MCEKMSVHCLLTSNISVFSISAKVPSEWQCSVRQKDEKKWFPTFCSYLFTHVRSVSVNNVSVSVHCLFSEILNTFIWVLHWHCTDICKYNYLYITDTVQLLICVDNLFCVHNYFCSYQCIILTKKHTILQLEMADKFLSSCIVSYRIFILQNWI